MFLDDLPSFFLEFVFYGFQHGVDVSVVEVEGERLMSDLFYQFSTTQVISKDARCVA